MPKFADEAHANAESIRSVPLGVLPQGAARAFLVQAALAGQDVNAYRPVQGPVPAGALPRWNVWVNGRRYSTEEWQTVYREQHITNR